MACTARREGDVTQSFYVRANRMNLKWTLYALAGMILLAACYCIVGMLIDMNRADRLWSEIKASAKEGSLAAFDPRVAAEPVQRYHRAAVRPGASMFRGVEIVMDGEFKMGDSWAPLEARQILVPGKGFVWRAKVGSGLFSMKGFDAYYKNEGSVNFRLWGLVPVAVLSGPDITRAAKGRLLAETTLVPSALFGLYGGRFRALNPRRIEGRIDVDGEETTIEIGIGQDGAPVEVVILRWGDVNPEKRFMYLPFGIRFNKMATIDGCTVPVEMAGGWNYGTPAYAESVRLRFREVHFF